MQLRARRAVEEAKQVPSSPASPENKFQESLQSQVFLGSLGRDVFQKVLFYIRGFKDSKTGVDRALTVPYAYMAELIGALMAYIGGLTKVSWLHMRPRDPGLQEI